MYHYHPFPNLSSIVSLVRRSCVGENFCFYGKGWSSAIYNTVEETGLLPLLKIAEFSDPNCSSTLQLWEKRCHSLKLKMPL